MDQKRFLLFIVLSLLIMVAYVRVRSWILPPDVNGRQAAQEMEAERKAPAADGQDKPAGDADSQPPQPEADVEPGVEDREPAPEEPQAPADDAAARPKRPAAPHRLLALGSLDPAADNLLAVLNSRGAAVERIELSQPKYRDLADAGGYLGYLGLSDEAKGGCRVNVVGPGTPAAQAKPVMGQAPAGLQVGDVILSLDGRPIQNAALLSRQLAQCKPGGQVRLVVQRLKDEAPQRVEFAAQLMERPLELIRPEPSDAASPLDWDPLSCLLTLKTASVEKRGAGPSGVLTGMLHDDWETHEIEPGRVVEFRYTLDDSQLQEIGHTGAVEIVKRYRMPNAASQGERSGAADPYHLELTVEIRNLDSQQDLEVVCQLDGPNGLPLEGWWYTRKYRDVLWRLPGQKQRLLSSAKIHKNGMKKGNQGESPTTTLFDSPQPAELEYAGVDTQYFAAVLRSAGADDGTFLFQDADALPLGDFSEKEGRDVGLTNVSVRLTSLPLSVAPGETLRRDFMLFAGPKDLAVLEPYGLSDAISYGWFGAVAEPLAWLLHVFYGWVRNYGVAIIMLTVLVRGCMFPISRKAAKNAQMMQQLAPEMKKIAEKHKSDAEKRMQAQRELYRKHNFNPFGGCLLMFLQLPVFIGLYRSLWVDINLRQAPLIPGLQWCSNLAGPDQLLRWKDWPWMPGFLVDETGFLGPYLNVLPIITIVLFLIQQKMFTPPATDEQTRMQQTMMKYMMVFIGVMFFKVASGLCIYFIASSLWGIAERKFSPKTPQPAGGEPASKSPVAAARPPARSGPNGSSSKAKKKQRRK